VRVTYAEAPGISSTTQLLRRSDTAIVATLTLAGTGSSSVSSANLYLDGSAGAAYSDGTPVATWGANEAAASRTWTVPTALPLGAHTWHVVATVDGSPQHWAFPVTVTAAYAVDAAIR
jgi:hypothetical protein